LENLDTLKLERVSDKKDTGNNGIILPKRTISQEIEKQYENWDQRFDGFEIKIEQMFNKLIGETDNLEKMVEHNLESNPHDKNGKKSHKIYESSSWFMALLKFSFAFLIGGVVGVSYIKSNSYDSVI